MLKGFVSGEEKDIKRIPMKGKNLFDKSNTTIYNAYINSQGYWLPSDDSRSVKIPCLPNTKYTLSIPLSVAIFRVYETSDSSALPSDQAVLNGLVREQDKSQSRFTTGANAAAIIFQGSAAAVDTWFNGLMLNLGSQALPYEPYGYQEGWEVRDNQDRLIWGREDELQTATGTLPFKGYALPVKVKSLLGNAVQNGTPSPQNIVTPEMCGVLNENLAIVDTDSYSLNNWYYEDTRLTDLLAPGTYTISFVTDSITSGVATDGTIGIGTTSDYTEDVEWFTREAVGSMTTVTVTLTESKCIWARFVRDHNIVKITCSISVSKIRVEEGSTAYGWKIPFENHGENLFDASLLQNNMHLDNTTGLPISYTGRIASPDPVDVSQYSTVTISYEAATTVNAIYSIFSNNELVGRFTAVSSGTVIDVSNADKMYICFYSTWGGNIDTSSVSKTMLNLGSTSKPYSPYLNATIPVYLGEVPTVRRVRKLVLTGQESSTWSYNVVIRNGNGFYNLSIFNGYKQNSGFGYCTHYPLATAITDTIGVFFGGNINFITAFSEGIDTADKWKSYLATQYANGTPVTVWYVLANEQTAISNEPLCKISTYADELNSTVATLPEIPTTTGQNTLTVETSLAPSKLEVSVHAKKIHYGFKIDKSNDDSDSAVIYTHDAVTMTPAHMDFTNDRFDYGSWGNAFFVRDCYPVALNLDGTIAYRLDPDDYTKKTDGTPSDIFYELLTAAPSDWGTQWKQYYTKSGDEYVLNDQVSAPTFATDTYYKLTYNSSFTGNFMMAFPKVWFYRHEDSQYNYIEISNYKLSDDWKCYAHINASGQEVDFIYLPLFKGVIVNSKLRSLPGQIPQGNTTATDEVNAATALGSRWQIWDHSSAECLNDLLTLMSKSIDSQGMFGKGRESGYDSTDTVTYGKLQTGTLIKGGKFHGFSSSYKEVKVFGMEGFWANRWDRLQGMLLVDNVWKIKMTPPYNFTGTDFITLSNASVPTGNGYLSKVQTSEYGSIPASIDGSSSTKYFKDYFYKTATDTRVALRGGRCDSGASCGFRYVTVHYTASASYWAFGASPVYK